jgi:tetratricopeptide (TPR) repeat protein
MNFWPPRLTSLCFFVFFILIRVTAAQQPGPCALPRFAEDAGALKAAAASANVKAGSDVVVLCDEDSYVFDSQGKSVHKSYFAYKVLSQRGAESWDEFSTHWEPWHDQKPTVRVRVISADGTVHVLDPKTLKDETATDEEDKIYSDARVLRGPLPAISVGAIVEQEVITAETEPFFAAGIVQRLSFGESVPTLDTRLYLDVPSTLKLKYESQLLPELKTERTESDGRIRVSFLQGPMAASETAETFLPGDIPSRPIVAFSVGSDWAGVADKYAEIVDTQISNADLKGVVSQVTQGKSTREEMAAALQEYVSKQVRYTGVEFGDAAIVPHSPEQTLKHQYGDCKDKSSLMVALLRTAGIPAYVALLNAGSRQDIPADLPGMGLFDHAIVYVPGEPEIWIDATDEYARLGQLPSADQGRFALIAKKGTTALVRTPEFASKENAVVETRDFYLAENGPARVVETTLPHGVYESQFRAYYADAENKQVKKQLTDYVTDVYLADRLSRTERSNPKDLSKQFQLEIEADKAKRGVTELESAGAAIRLEWLFNRLPGELQEREKEKKKDAAGNDGDDAPKKPRTQDYLLPAAFVSEWKYKIVPPAGFQPNKLPPDRKVQLGPAVYEQQFSVAKDNVVEGTLRFDTVKRRLTVAEMEALRDGVVQLREQQPILIEFELTAAALRSQGKVRESLQSTRALIAMHPKESVHHLQMADGLLMAGLGQPAREEAREAVKLEPGSALAQKTLADILEYDTLGRKFRVGSDYAGAAEAYRAAAKLDPDDKAIRGNLGILLEYNKYGERYGDGAPLKEAIQEYQTLKPEQLREIGLANNIAYAMFYAGEFAEARKNTETLNPQPNTIIVATEAALSGTAAAVAEAGKRSPKEEDQKQLLRSAGDILLRVRVYPQAADLLEAGASGNDASRTLGLAALVRKMSPHEKMVYEETPAGLVRKITVSTLEGNFPPEAMIPILSRNALKVYKNTDPEELERMRKDDQKIRRSLVKAGYPAEVMVDLTNQLLDIKTEGDDGNGYRVDMRAGGKNEVFYVVKEEGKYKLLDGSEKPNAIGLEIVDRLAAGNPAGARILLDWVRQDQHITGGDDALAGYAFPRMWTKGKEGDARAMKLAAAALLCETKTTAADGVKLLEDSRADAKDDVERLNVSLAMLDGYAVLGNYGKEYEIATELAKEHPDSKRVLNDRAASLRFLGRGPESDELLKTWLKKQPDDLGASRGLVFNAVEREDYAAALVLAKEILESSQADANDYNSAAWYGLFTGKAEDVDVATATKSLQLSQNNTASMHTLGCVYAAAGKPKEAREVFLQAMELLDMEEPDPNYWYGFGRVAEDYGEPAAALEDYKNVTKPSKAIWIPGSSYRLAQMRLAEMGKGAAVGQR